MMNHFVENSLTDQTYKIEVGILNQFAYHENATRLDYYCLQAKQ